MIMVLCFLFIFFKSNFLQFSPDGPANAVQPKTLVARGVIVPGGCGGGGGGQGVEELFLYHCPSRHRIPMHSLKVEVSNVSLHFCIDGR